MFSICPFPSSLFYQCPVLLDPLCHTASMPFLACLVADNQPLPLQQLSHMLFPFLFSLHDYLTLISVLHSFCPNPLLTSVLITLSLQVMPDLQCLIKAA